MRQLFLATLLMVVLPLGTFFISERIVLEGREGMTAKERLIWSGIAAVVVVQASADDCGCSAELFGACAFFAQ